MLNLDISKHAMYGSKYNQIYKYDMEITILFSCTNNPLSFNETSIECHGEKYVGICIDKDPTNLASYYWCGYIADYGAAGELGVSGHIVSH